jgi:acyl-CoA thioesterase-1
MTNGSGGRPYVLAIGDSLTAGYGLTRSESFSAQLELLLRNRYSDADVQNAGVSGDTSASARQRLPRLLSSLKRLPDLAIVELGANDLLRGMPPEQTRINLDVMLTELIRCRIPVLIAAMEAPRFLGPYADGCDAIYTDLAIKHRVPVWPFFPSGVLGNRALTLPDRLHPNARAISMIARHMLPAVLDALPQDAPAAVPIAREN